MKPLIRIAFDEKYVLPLPKKHRFPMDKYALIPWQLQHLGYFEASDFFSPIPVSWDDVELTHSKAYCQKLRDLSLSKQEIRRSGFPLSKALVERELSIVGGTLACAHFALETGVALNVAGGTHHAFTDRAEGFCILNDVAVAANLLLKQQIVKRVLVIDLDVHQGNGTAQIFEGSPDVFTFSMHGEKNYPMHKERSSWDIELPDDISDDEYLAELIDALSKLQQTVAPCIVFYQSGVDVLKQDKLGRLGLSINGCKQRDTLVFEFCKAQNIPCVVTMGGGYSPDIKDIVQAHTNTFLQAQMIYESS